MPPVVDGREVDFSIEEITVTINKRLPERVPCPHCHKQKITQVERERSCIQIVFSALLCLGVIVLWPFAVMMWKN